MYCFSKSLGSVGSFLCQRMVASLLFEMLWLDVVAHTLLELWDIKRGERASTNLYAASCS